MTKISSKFTFFHKKVFPLFWFGFLSVFMAMALIDRVFEKDPMFLIGPIAMAAIGFVVMKKMVWDLVDEVYDCGEFLLIKNRGEEDRILLSNIMNVNTSTMMNPPRITLRLVNPGKFGSEIVFSPTAPFTFNPFAKNPVAEGLIVRVDKARTNRVV